ncbi:cytochrome P450 [Tropicimonas sediminicola]|uniref:Unspecific monooxygenase n=1 Tax=Tropicimonas sediminicola TaxID=1031541 RepID=A0A239DDP1_9RHOB|nr:cytochrome P450 [Tropicimonas sediminicola]SNS29803.1 unspecific monooxygenase [Tropicimonas sediminicola]
MDRLSQSPTDPAFVQDPYRFYACARASGDLVFWEEYGMVAATTHRAVNAILRDRRFGREIPPELAQPVPERLAPFYAVEAHSMLELEPPRHTRLRGLVVRAFTTARIEAMAPDIDTLATRLVSAFPEGPFDLLDALARPLPVTVIARLLGVPEDRTSDLLAWSNAMVGMYQASRTRETEDAAVAATLAFRAYLEEVIGNRRTALRDDLLSRLISAEADGDRLSADELVSTVILLLNAGHEATVHSIGNGVKAIVERGLGSAARDPALLPTLVEEVLRHDPPLHLFTRYAYEEVEMFGHRFRRGEQVACLLASANRDATVFPESDRFDPARPIVTNASFGAGLHFCIGAPLARLELSRTLPILFAACRELQIANSPRYADIYHFHGLERLMLTC